MSFFAPPPPPSEPPERPASPPWFGPPANELGELIPTRALLVRQPDLAIALTDLVAYSNGIAGRFVLRMRETRMREGLMHPMHGMRHGLAGAAELPPDLLRFGVEFSDGRRATTIDGRQRPRDEPPEIVFRQGGGGGGGGSWEFGFWIWPLPPEGPVTFAVEWPSEGIELTTCQIDSKPILEAAARSEPLWEEGGGSAVSTVHRTYSTMTAQRVLPPEPPSGA